MNWLIFFFGIVVGATVGVVLSGILTAASRYDEDLGDR